MLINPLTAPSVYKETMSPMWRKLVVWLILTVWVITYQGAICLTVKPTPYASPLFASDHKYHVRVHILCPLLQTGKEKNVCCREQATFKFNVGLMTHWISSQFNISSSLGEIYMSFQFANENSWLQQRASI